MTSRRDNFVDNYRSIAILQLTHETFEKIGEQLEGLRSMQQQILDLALRLSSKMTNSLLATP
jgi:predicted ATPase